MVRHGRPSVRPIIRSNRQTNPSIHRTSPTSLYCCTYFYQSDYEYVDRRYTQHGDMPALHARTYITESVDIVSTQHLSLYDTNGTARPLDRDKDTTVLPGRETVPPGCRNRKVSGESSCFACQSTSARGEHRSLELRGPPFCSLPFNKKKTVCSRIRVL